MTKVAPGIDQLPSGAFRWRVKVGGVLHSGTASTLAAARRARLDAELTDPDEYARRREAPTVAEVLDWWVADVKHSPTTATTRDSALRQLPASFLAANAAKLKAPAVAALYRRMLADGAGPATVVKVRNSLSRAFAQAVELGVLEVNPIRGVKAPSLPAARYVAPPVDEVRAAIERCEVQPMLAAWVRLMATIGPRPGEACALRWDGFDVDRGMLHVGPSVTKDGELTEGKNGRKGWRMVQLGLPTAAALRRLERVVGIPWIFHANAEPWRPDDASRWFRARNPDVTWRPYDLRHFAATRALVAGVPVAKVAYMLGDNPATVMKHYVHDDDDGGAASAVDALLG